MRHHHKNDNRKCINFKRCFNWNFFSQEKLNFYSDPNPETQMKMNSSVSEILLACLFAFILKFPKKKHIRCAGRGRQQADQWESSGERQSHSGIGVLFLLSGGGPLSWILQSATVMDAASAIHGNACICLSLVVISRRWRYGFVDQESVRILVIGKKSSVFFLCRPSIHKKLWVAFPHHLSFIRVPQEMLYNFVLHFYSIVFNERIWIRKNKFRIRIH